MGRLRSQSSLQDHLSGGLPACSLSLQRLVGAPAQLQRIRYGSEADPKIVPEALPEIVSEACLRAGSEAGSEEIRLGLV